MKRFVILLLPLLFVLGCQESIVEISPPVNLEITGAKADTLYFSWVESQTDGIDGYIFYLNDEPFDTVGLVSSALVTPPGLGDITLRAYKGDNLSEPSDTVNTDVYEGGPFTIYWFGSENESGFGWDQEGYGKVYSFSTSNEDSVDIYLDKDGDLASPDTYTETKWNKCEIAEVDGDVDMVPEGIQYSGGVHPETDGYYIVKLPNHGPNGYDQYVKLHVTTYETANDTSVTFEYWFQKIENYTRFK